MASRPHYTILVALMIVPVALAEKTCDATSPGCGNDDENSLLAMQPKAVTHTHTAKPHETTKLEQEVDFYRWRPTTEELEVVAHDRERILKVETWSAAYHGDDLPGFPAFHKGSMGPGGGPGEAPCPHSCAFAGMDRSEASSADVLLIDSQDGDLPPFPKRRDQIWIGSYWEAPAHYPSLRSNFYMRKFDYTASYSENSTIPSFAMMQDTMGDWSQALGHPPAFSFAKKRTQTAIMSMWISNCGVDNSGRLALAKSLMAHGVEVASYGACSHNRDEPSELELRFIHSLNSGLQKQQESSKYLFLFAAENAYCPDYHSEKIYDAFLAGVVPVYVGARTIVDHIPDHSVIMADDFKSPSELATYLQKVASNETLYESYLAWRNKPLPPHLARMVKSQQEFGSDQWRCHLCRFLHMHHPKGTAQATSCDPPTPLINALL